jgi:hypothetical protein
MSKHTPGPWWVDNFIRYNPEVKDNETGDVWESKTVWIKDSCGNIMGEVKSFTTKHFNHDIDKVEANASLIAAAPELLEALQEILPYVNDLEAENFTDPSAGIFQDAKLTKAVRKIEEAIAKAIGEKEEA